MEYWVCSFSFAHADTVYMPWETGQSRITYAIDNNISGEKVRFRFSNRCGTKAGRIISVSAGGSAEDCGTKITYRGERDFLIPPGQSLLSDEAVLSVRPGEPVWIQMRLDGTEKPQSGYRVDDVSLGYLEELDVLTDKDVSVVAAFGDSITRMGTWTVPLQKKLYRSYPGLVSFSNKGLSGNRLIHNCMAVHHGAFGVSGVARFPYDVAELPGLTHVIFSLGTNDLGHPGEPDCPITEQISFEDYTDAVSDMAEKTHRIGASIYGATITARKLNPPYWTAEKEQMREKLNDWIRRSGTFDAVLDYDAVTRNPDGLHLSAQGGAAIAESIPTELFIPPQSKVGPASFEARQP